MQLRLYDIYPVLQPYVKMICSMENANGEMGLHAFRILPDTCVELFVNYRDTKPAAISCKTSLLAGRSFIISRMSDFMDVQSQEDLGCITVCFHPGKAYHFFSLPMNEISDTVTDMRFLWKEIAAEMEDRVAEAHVNLQRVMIIQEFLIHQLKKYYKEDKTVDYCLWQMNLLKGQSSVNELSEKSGISQRQLARRFNDRAGLSPKEFLRITKFIHSLEHLKKYPAMSLTAIAYESGYYDQAHFIHDCREYSGLSPRQLLASKDIFF